MGGKINTASGTCETLSKALTFVSLESQEKKVKLKKIFKELMADIFPNLTQKKKNQNIN